MTQPHFRVGIDFGGTKTEVIALDGAVSIAVFSMERQPNRSWRISGCHLLESKQFAT